MLDEQEKTMSIKVAIFEDNDELREGLYYLVNGTSGYECVGAYPNCDRLTENLHNNPPDVVLMDIGMPGMSGIEGVKLLTTHYPKVKVIMQTVLEDDQKIFDSILAGASGYLLKKTPPAKILEAISEVHQGGAPMTSKIARRVLTMFHQPGSPHSTQYDLSDREREILNGLVKGMSYKMIADQHFISIDTVRSHIKNIYDKLHVHSKGEAIAKALKDRLV